MSFSTLHKDRIPFLIVSCDKYSDLWPLFFSHFWLKWPDCPFEVFLGSNEEKYVDPRVKNLNIGKDITWASNLLKMLDMLKSRYILLSLDDFFLFEKVQTETIEKLCAVAIEGKIECLRLGDGNYFRENSHQTKRLYEADINHKPVAQNFGNLNLGEILPGTPYRISTQIALWEVEALRKILLPGFNIWQFEEIGTQLSQVIPLSVWTGRKPILKYIQVIERGKWTVEGIKLCNEANLVINFKKRARCPEITLNNLDIGLNEESTSEVYHKMLNSLLRSQRTESILFMKKYLSKNRFSLKLFGILLIGLIGGKSSLFVLKAIKLKIQRLRYKNIFLLKRRIQAIIAA